MNKSKSYFPERGDIIWLDLNPQAGREIAKRRPAIVVSPVQYNRLVGLCLVCPITSQKKGYVFEVALKNKQIDGVVLCDQVKCMDYPTRNAEFIGKCSAQTLQEIQAKIKTLVL